MNMKELVNESLAIAGGRLKRVQVITEIPDELTHHCFRARVGQILVNLLGNASDAFDEAGTQAPTSVSRYNALRVTNRFALKSQTTVPVSHPTFKRGSLRSSTRPKKLVRERV